MPPLLPRTIFRTLALSLLMLPLGAWPAMAQTPAAGPEVKGKRVFTCAHSFHVFVYRMLDEPAKGAGIPGHENVGLSSIGGCKVIQHWNAREEKNAARTALDRGQGGRAHAGADLDAGQGDR